MGFDRGGQRCVGGCASARCLEFIVARECLCVCDSPFLSLSPSELFIVSYSGRGMGPVGRLEKCQRAFCCWFPIGPFTSYDRVWVLVCYWKWDKEEWGACISVCILSLFLCRYCPAAPPPPWLIHSLRQPQQKLNTESNKGREGGKERENVGRKLSVREGEFIQTALARAFDW